MVEFVHIENEESGADVYYCISHGVRFGAITNLRERYSFISDEGFAFHSDELRAIADKIDALNGELNKGDA